MGRDFVSPDDVKQVAPAALAHRIVLAHGVDVRGGWLAVGEIVGAVESPRPVSRRIGRGVNGPGELTLTSIVLFTLGAYGIAAGAASGEQSVVAVGVFAFALFVVGIVWPIVDARRRRRRRVGAGRRDRRRAATTCTCGCTGASPRVEVRRARSAGRVVGHRGAGRRRDPARRAAGAACSASLRIELRTSAPLGVFVRTRVVRVELPDRARGRARARSRADGAAHRAARAPARRRALGDVDRRSAAAATRSARCGRTCPATPARLVHWPTSARRGTLVVREHEPPAVARGRARRRPRGTPDDAERAASRAAGIGRATLAAGGARLVLHVRGGAVRCRRASSTHRDLGRRLARARRRRGRRRRPPGWPVEVVHGVSAAEPAPEPRAAVGARDRRGGSSRSRSRSRSAAVGAIAASRVGFPLVARRARRARSRRCSACSRCRRCRRAASSSCCSGSAGSARCGTRRSPGPTRARCSCAGPAATLVALLLVDRADAEQVQPLPRGAPLAEPRAARSRASSVAIAVIVAVAVVALGPTVTDHLGRHVWPGLDPAIGDLHERAVVAAQRPTSST